MFFHRSLFLEVRTFAAVPLLVVALSSPLGTGRRGELFVAWSADDPALRMRIAALSPTVSPDEAQRVADTAYMTGRELHREWRVAWIPGIQNFLVNTGRRKGGLCFQWATELLIRLDALKLQTLELHWAESGPNTGAEHNVIVVTAKGQPFGEGILLDLALLGNSRLVARRHGSGLSLDGKQIRNRPQIGENNRCSFEAITLYDEIELTMRNNPGRPAPGRFPISFFIC